MRSDRWTKVNQLFYAALEKPPEEWNDFLQQECAQDLQLRKEVESLLAAHQKGEKFIQNPVDPISYLSEPEKTLTIGERIGSYKIVKEIGRGGMGAVYLASRADELFTKLVAIKLIKRGMDTDDVLRHFRTERQILANFDHPNIARLLDGGSTDNGLPYFVMEYVEGKPIDEYCDERSLSITERVELFLQVCAAVSYAHRNLVVHRDLKPSNILITKEGIPKLLDFGIAKILQKESAERSTATGLLLMTPEYASPEQAQGLPVTTLSDVYSLGVILYELLTGHDPYSLNNRSAIEIARTITETQPQAPSTIVDSDVSKTREGTRERLRKRLHGDLDNIVLMALRKEPERRYQSVTEFADDLKRHLNKIPVIARKSSFQYRASKFIGRHKVSVTATLIVALLLIAFAITMYSQSQKMAKQRDVAEKERDTAQEVSKFLVDIFHSSDPYQAKGNTIPAREVLDHGATKIKAELQNKPEVRAALMDTMGQVYVNLDLYDKAEPLLTEALNLRRKILPPDHPDLIESLNHLGELHYGQSKPDAENYYKEAIAIGRQISPKEPVKLADSLSGLGRVFSVQGKRNEAISLFREAIALQKKFLGNNQVEVARNLTRLAQLLGTSEAESMYQEASVIFKKANDPAEATCLIRLAEFDSERGNYDKAIQRIGDACTKRKRIFGEQSESLAWCMTKLGDAYYQNGENQSAEKIYAQTLALREKSQGPDNPEVGYDLLKLAKVLHREGNLKEAEPLYRRSLSLENKDVSEFDFAESSIGLGNLLTDTGRAAEAEPLIESGRDLLKKMGNDTQEADSILGQCLTQLGKYPEAEQLLVRSYKSQLNLDLKSAAREKQETRERLIRLYKAWGKPEKLASYIK
jgi:eukaryotic-like serine/threonine-protein kinase